MPADGKVVPWYRCLLVALPGWVVARLIVLSAFALADRPEALIGDAAWYHDLGVRGYGPYGAEGARFFPLLPAAVAVGVGLGVPAAVWQLAVCWVAALVFAAALVRLTVRESGDEAAGHRIAWLIQLVPGANVLVLGYPEALAGLLAVAYFLALRSLAAGAPAPGSARGVGIGVGVGFLSGLARPAGPLLALPGFVEAVRSAFGGDRPKDADGGDGTKAQKGGKAQEGEKARDSDKARDGGKAQEGAKAQSGGKAQGDDDGRDRAKRRGAGRGGGVGRSLARWGPWLVAVAPLAGTGGYLAWAWWALGDPLAPYRAYLTANLSESVTVWELLPGTAPGGYPWALVLLLATAAGVALYLCGRRLPFAYLAWAVPMLALAVTVWGVPSLPRYLAAVFPLWMALAIVVRDRRLWLTLMTASIAGFVWVAWLAIAPDGPIP